MPKELDELVTEASEYSLSEDWLGRFVPLASAIPT